MKRGVTQGPANTEIRSRIRQALLLLCLILGGMVISTIIQVKGSNSSGASVKTVSPLR